MNENSRQRSRDYRRAHASKFKQIGDGVFGGYKSGVMNGPEPSTDRGRRRAAKKKTG